MGWASRLNAGAMRSKPNRTRGYSTGRHVRFRPLERRDVPQIYHWFDHDRTPFWNQQAWTMQSFYDLVGNADHFAYAVLRGGFLAGFGKLSWLDRDAGVLTPMVLVDPGQRDRGLGTTIASELVTNVARHVSDCVEVRAGAFATNAAAVALAATLQKAFDVEDPVRSTAPDGRDVLTWSLLIHHRIEPRRKRVVD